MFSATASGVTTVNIPAAATIHIDYVAHTPDVTIEGTGRMYGFLLSQVSEIPRQSKFLLGLNTAQCWQPACVPQAPFATFEYVSDTNLTQLSAETFELPAGDYELFFITDGGPIAVELRLGGLEGSASLQPSRPSRLIIRDDFPATRLIDGNEVFYSAGGSEDITTQLGLYFYMLTWETQPLVATWGQHCMDRDSDPPAGLYSPGCSIVEDHMGPWVVIAPHVIGSSYGAGYTLVPGRWNQGQWHVVASGPEVHHLTQLWMDVG